MSEPHPLSDRPASLAAPVARAARRAALARRGLAILSGALLVALAAQVSVDLQFTRVPMTLQPLAVLVVGGLLGPAAGASSLVLYLLMGSLGLPVFAGGAAGFLHLLGPTGGYLLAYPLAAAITGRLAAGPAGSAAAWPRPVDAGRAAGTGRAAGAGRAAARALLACAAGMLVVHVGGVAQLAALTGDLDRAVRLGFVPFFTGDLVKVGLAALVLLRFRSRVRALL